MESKQFTKVIDMDKKTYLVAGLVAVAVAGFGAFTIITTPTHSFSSGTIAGESLNISYLSTTADQVAVVDVASISAAEWSTDDGERPDEVTASDLRGIHRDADLSIQEELRGDFAQSVEIELPGGKIQENPIQTFSHSNEFAPNLEEGERYVIFFKQHPDTGELFIATKFSVFQVTNGSITTHESDRYEQRTLTLDQVKSLVQRWR